MKSILDVFKKDTSETLGNLLDTSAKPAPSNGSAAAPALNLETSASSAALKEASKKRAKKPESGKSAFSFDDTSTAKIDAEQSELLAALFKPEIWKQAVAAPGDFAFAMTGREHWVLTDPEKETLAASGSVTMRAFMVTDPKWIALTLFSLSALTIYGGRLLQDVREQKKAEKKNPSMPLAATVQ